MLLFHDFLFRKHKKNLRNYMFFGNLRCTTIYCRFRDFFLKKNEIVGLYKTVGFLKPTVFYFKFFFSKKIK